MTFERLQSILKMRFLARMINVYWPDQRPCPDGVALLDTINQLECVTELPGRVTLDGSAGAEKGLFVSLCLLGLFMEWCVHLTCCRVVTKTDLKNAWGFSVPWPGTESYFTASFFSGAHHKSISVIDAVCISMRICFEPV